MINPLLFTSESVAVGHPDKVADQIADSILDAALSEDPYSRVASEVLITKNLVVLAGEVSTRAKLDYEAIAQNTLREIGYGTKESGFDLEKAKFLITLHEQSPDIASALHVSSPQVLGAGDQGSMFGFACTETAHLMPLSLELSHLLVRGLKDLRSKFPSIRPDGKAQVTVEYESWGIPKRIDTLVLSVQHDEGTSLETLKELLMTLVKEVIPSRYLDEHTRYLINPGGRFVIGGPDADTGLTGRKIIVDSYGGRGHHGGGAFSGKDATKMDRSGAYAARYIAKHLVAAGFANECEVQLSYAIGMCEPVSIRINTFGKNSLIERELETLVLREFPVTPQDIIDELRLREPIFKETAFGGHFGREQFPWEKLDRLHLFK